MNTFTSRFAIGDRVRIDGHSDMIAVVTGNLWRGDNWHEVEVSWINAGAMQTSWMPPWRLDLA